MKTPKHKKSYDSVQDSRQKVDKLMIIKHKRSYDSVQDSSQKVDELMIIKINEF